MLETLTSFFLAPMMAWSAPANHAYLHETPLFVESRYYEIAHDLAEVVSTEEPLDIWVEPLEVRQAHTGVLMLAISSFESGGYRADVDADKKRGDRGKSHCLMQVMLRSNEPRIEDRKACFRLGLSRIKESLALCPSLPIQFRLAGYTGGSCFKGLEEAQRRFNRSEVWWKNHEWFGRIDTDEWLDDKD